MRRMNSKGVTLIETIIVLGIVLLILQFSMSQFLNLSKENTIEEFFTTLEKDVFMMQQYTITNENQILSLYFNTEQNYYVIYDSPLNPELLRREYNPNIKVTFTTLNNPIRFRSSGTPFSPGKMRITYNNYTYEVTFQFGKGRFYVSKL